MEDKSIVSPILEALNYFNDSKEEINYFYKIIDKFCACWFGKNVNITSLNSVELALIHDLLAEYIRFEENNKRIALWLLSINRVCYNYTRDLSELAEELNSQKNLMEESFDTTLIQPILNQLNILDNLHKNAGKTDHGESDIISNFLQWVMVYTTIIYPSLENKLNFYDKTIIKAMHFILLEFIKQRSNDKRMAYLIMAIKEACKNYSLQNENESATFINENIDDSIVPAGQEEKLIKELLEKLKDQTIIQREYEEESIETYIKNNYDDFIDKLLTSKTVSYSFFLKFVNKLAEKVLTLTTDKKIMFFKVLYRYRSYSNIFNDDVKNEIKKGLEKLPEKTKKWIIDKVKDMNLKKEEYIKEIIQKDSSEKNKFLNFIRLYIMIFLIHKLNIF